MCIKRFLFFFTSISDIFKIFHDIYLFNIPLAWPIIWFSMWISLEVFCLRLTRIRSILLYYLFVFFFFIIYFRLNGASAYVCCTHRTNIVFLFCFHQHSWETRSSLHSLLSFLFCYYSNLICRLFTRSR